MSSSAQPCRLINLLLTSILAVSLALPSSAHEQKTALTDVFYNERTGNLEIAHRFSLHDAEHTLHKVTESKADLARSIEARAAFGKYVAGRFALSFQDGTPLKLTMVGQEIERGYIWVYQETKLPDPFDAAFFIRNTILQDVVEGQINTVNVRCGSRVATFEFRADSEKQIFSRPTDSDHKDGDAGK